MSIIFLSGITKKHVDKLINGDIDNYIDSYDVPVETREYLCSVPKVFTSVNEWVDQVDLDCEHCCRPITSRPIPVPSGCYHDSKTRQLIIKVSGLCDTWNCAQAVINYSCKRERDELSNLLRILYEKFTDERISIIIPAPDKKIQCRFCGPEGMTDDEYQDKINELTHQATSIHY